MRNNSNQPLVKWASIILLSILIISVFFIRPLPQLPLSNQQLSFVGKLAYEKMIQLSENFPYRVQGNKNLALSESWVANEFRNLGYTPQFQTFLVQKSNSRVQLEKS